MIDVRPIPDQIRDQIEGLVRDRIWGQTGRWTEDHVWNQIWHQVNDRVREHSMRHAIRDQVNFDLRGMLR